MTDIAGWSKKPTFHVGYREVGFFIDIFDVVSELDQLDLIKDF